MRLDGIHHITAITADAPRNLDFYSGLLGLRFVKKTVNFDAPDVYHLYYGDELGNPGSLLTFFEFPQAPRGQPGDGMIWRLILRAQSPASLRFWADRLADAGVDVDTSDRAVGFHDPEGLALEIVVAPGTDPPLVAATPDIAAEHALIGIDGVRAYSAATDRSRGLLEKTLGFEPDDSGVLYRLDGEHRHAFYSYDAPPAQRGRQAAGTVHHIAWAVADDEHEAWHSELQKAGARPTPIIDRTYFRSIYFREPSGVLFELATYGPGFTVDEPADRLGESLALPPQHEPMRGRLEQSLTPLVNPRSAQTRR